jgi:hypothetical protein
MLARPRRQARRHSAARGCFIAKMNSLVSCISQSCHGKMCVDRKKEAARSNQSCKGEARLGCFARPLHAIELFGAPLSLSLEPKPSVAPQCFCLSPLPLYTCTRLKGTTTPAPTLSLVELTCRVLSSTCQRTTAGDRSPSPRQQTICWPFTPGLVPSGPCDLH